MLLLLLLILDTVKWLAECLKVTTADMVGKASISFRKKMKAKRSRNMAAAHWRFSKCSTDEYSVKYISTKM